MERFTKLQKDMIDKIKKGEAIKRRPSYLRTLNLLIKKGYVVEKNGKLEVTPSIEGAGKRKMPKWFKLAYDIDCV